MLRLVFWGEKSKSLPNDNFLTKVSVWKYTLHVLVQYVSKTERIKSAASFKMMPISFYEFCAVVNMCHPVGLLALAKSSSIDMKYFT